MVRQRRCASSQRFVTAVPMASHAWEVQECVLKRILRMRSWLPPQFLSDSDVFRSEAEGRRVGDGSIHVDNHLEECQLLHR